MPGILNKLKNKDLFWFVCFVFFFGLLAILRGQDANWDLLNYHFYTAYSFFNGRFDIDIIPAGLHTFHSPMADIPYYFLVKYFNNFPRLVAFYLGIWGGACAFLFYKISKKVFPANQIYLWLSVVLGVTGVAAFSLTGTTMGDTQSAVFVLLSIYLLIKSGIAAGKRTSWKYFALSAFMFGIAFGLKYTNGPFSVGLAAFIIYNCKSFKDFLIKGVVYFTVFIAGALLVNGYFMYVVYQQTGNPFFPYLNHIFYSPLYAKMPLGDTIFIPKRILDIIFFPLQWLVVSPHAISEKYADMHFPAAYISVFVLSWILFFKKDVKELQKALNLTLLKSVLLFWIVSYIIWLYSFSILRYMVVLDYINGIIIMALAAYVLIKRPKVIWLVFLVIGLIIGYTRYPDFWKVPISSKVFDVKPLEMEDNALVVMLENNLSYLVPFLGEDKVYIGGLKYDYNSLYNEPGHNHPNIFKFYKHNFYGKMQQAVNDHDGTIYVMFYNRDMGLHPLTLGRLGLWYDMEERCYAVDTNMIPMNNLPVMCKVQKTKQRVSPAAHKVY